MRLPMPLRLVAVACYFALTLSIVVHLWGSLPPLESAVTLEKSALGIPVPRSLDDAKVLGRYLGSYIDEHFGRVVLVFCSTYVFLQSFSIPGSVFLSILSGALFRFPLALFLVCLCSSFGATSARFLSAFLGSELVEKYFAKRLPEWRSMVERNRDNLFYFMIFLRVTPLVPNFFLNISSPHVNVPFPVFYVGTFFGVALPSILFIRLGRALQELTSAALPWSTTLMLLALGVISLLPAIYKDRIQKRFQGGTTEQEVRGKKKQ